MDYELEDDYEDEDDYYNPDVLLPVTEIVLHWEHEGSEIPYWAFTASGTRPDGSTIVVDSDGPIHMDPKCPIPDLLGEAYKRLERDNCPPPIEDLLGRALWHSLPAEEGVGWYWTGAAHGVPYERAVG